MEMMMMISSNPERAPMNESLPITTTTCPSWKLYENPFYNAPITTQIHQKKHLDPINFPLSARKIAASFWDLTLFRPIMETELEIARTHIMELKAELELERKARKKLETINKRMARELGEERRGREALERVCEQLAREVSSEKAEIDRLKKGIEEERKMLRMAEVLREERVQMKLADAKILLEEKLSELEGSNGSSKRTEPDPEIEVLSKTAAKLSIKFSSFGEKDNAGSVSATTHQRRASPEPENPHITRGIKGFVEFPRVVRAIGSKSRHWGTKLECQKAQLRILLKQKCPIRSNNLIIS